jgi:hypothetical protein
LNSLHMDFDFDLYIQGHPVSDATKSTVNFAEYFFTDIFHLQKFQPLR